VRSSKPKNRYYPFSFCPGFWKALIAQHQKSRVFSIDRVRDELIKPKNEAGDKPDELSNWAKDQVPDTFFKKTLDQEVVKAFREIIAWVSSEAQFTPAAKAEFADKADGWLIAYARVNGHVLVTHEEHAPDAKAKVPIPNVCLEFDVEYVDTFEMLENLGVKLILSPRRPRRR
jgi:hypothetical protein